MLVVIKLNVINPRMVSSVRREVPCLTQCELSGSVCPCGTVTSCVCVCVCVCLFVCFCLCVSVSVSVSIDLCGSDTDSVPSSSLPTALLYKPIDRVTRSTLVLHVSTQLALPRL